MIGKVIYFLWDVKGKSPRVGVWKGRTAFFLFSERGDVEFFLANPLGEGVVELAGAETDAAGFELLMRLMRLGGLEQVLLLSRDGGGWVMKSLDLDDPLLDFSLAGRG